MAPRAGSRGDSRARRRARTSIKIQLQRSSSRANTCGRKERKTPLALLLSLTLGALQTCRSERQRSNDGADDTNDGHALKTSCINTSARHEGASARTSCRMFAGRERRTDPLEDSRARPQPEVESQGSRLQSRSLSLLTMAVWCSLSNTGIRTIYCEFNSVDRFEPTSGLASDQIRRCAKSTCMPRRESTPRKTSFHQPASADSVYNSQR